MVAALCLWLLSQRTEDERTQRIHVLTPYRAQVCSYDTVGINTYNFAEQLEQFLYMYECEIQSINFEWYTFILVSAAD